jgi:hypothetical protein
MPVKTTDLPAFFKPDPDLDRNKRQLTSFDALVHPSMSDMGVRPDVAWTDGDVVL